MLPFEIASLILLAAMVGAIFLARETALEEERADWTSPRQIRWGGHRVVGSLSCSPWMWRMPWFPCLYT